MSHETVTPGLDLVVEAFRRKHLRVLWGPTRFVGQPAAVLSLKEFETMSRDVLRRAQAFREQLVMPGTSPLLALPGLSSGCRSTPPVSGFGFRSGSSPVPLISASASPPLKSARCGKPSGSQSWLSWTRCARIADQRSNGGDRLSGPRCRVAHGTRKILFEFFEFQIIAARRRLSAGRSPAASVARVSARSRRRPPGRPSFLPDRSFHRPDRCG
jgi:hypothetical protein